MKLDNEIDWGVFPYQSYPVTAKLAKLDTDIITISDRLATLALAMNPDIGETVDGLPRIPYPDPVLLRDALTGEMERLRDTKELVLRIQAMQELGI